MNCISYPALTAALLSWYKTNLRDLPWRQTKDPYRIWVSEIMLQQTQVSTVIPYYKKWMRRFPTVRSLAKASTDSILKHWAGLGYYRRAKMLHRSAQVVTTELGGRLPSEVNDLALLPGIGRYTAGAISSIAFNRPSPILDGNVKRILARIFAILLPANSKKGEERLWRLAATLVKTSGSPGDFNQAMMELGATVCLPRTPHCNTCPVVRFCKAHARGRQTSYPFFSRKERIKKMRSAALVLRKNGSVLIQKQPEDGRWGGLWMFPHWETKKGMSDSGWEPRKLKRVMKVKHGYTKYRIELDVYEARIYDRSAMPGRWVSEDRLGRYAFPSPHKKIVTNLVGHHA